MSDRWGFLFTVNWGSRASGEQCVRAPAPLKQRRVYRERCVAVDTSSEPHAKVKAHYATVAHRAELAASANGSDEAGRWADQLQGSDLTGALLGAERIDNLPAAALASCRGCADLVGRAALQEGEVVLDLGCGGGAEVILAARLVGERGFTYGLDMTDEMLELAAKNIIEARVSNAQIIKGHIEAIPLPPASVDVVLSNCVLNFCAHKRTALSEAFRVLKPGGRMVISDLVSFEPIAPEVYHDLCTYVGCFNGMSSDEEYRELFEQAGFEKITLMQAALFTYASMERRARASKCEKLFAPLKAYAREVDRVSGSIILEANKPD